jgi:hypothetical protein
MFKNGGEIDFFPSIVSGSDDSNDNNSDVQNNNTSTTIKHNTFIIDWLQLKQHKKLRKVKKE